MQFQVIKKETLEEEVLYAPLDPGPALYVLPKNLYNKKYAVCSTNFGSIDNAFYVKENGSKETVRLPDGIAHFLEHKLFDDEEGNVFDRFAYYGASPNAYTSFTNTGYLFSCTEYFHENFDLLLEFVRTPYFTEESVAKEQGIIEQEIRMYEDNPQWQVFFNLLRALYKEHPVRNDIAGSVESIRSITKDLLYKCYNTFYHPQNMAIFVTGDVSPEKVLEQVSGSLEQKPAPPRMDIERVYPQEDSPVNQREVTQKLSVSEPLVNIGFKDDFNYLRGRELLFRELTHDLLLEMIFGKSEPTFMQLYEEGLIDEHFSAGYVAETTYGYTLLGGKTKDPEKLYDRVFSSIEGIKKEGLSQQNFERHKRKMRGDLLQSFNSLEFIANNYLSYKFRGVDFFEILDILEGVSLEQLEKRLHEHLREENHAISIILPPEGSSE